MMQPVSGWDADRVSIHVLQPCNEMNCDRCRWTCSVLLLQLIFFSHTKDLTVQQVFTRQSLQTNDVQHMLQSNMCVKDTEPIPGCCLCVGYGQRKLGESQRFKDRCHLALVCGENTVSCNCWLSACCVGEGFFLDNMAIL